MKKVAKELNELMGLSPAIDIELEGDALIEKIKEAADELIEEDEEQLSKRTVTKLKKLGLWINQDVKEEDKVKPEKVKPTEAEKEQIPEKPEKPKKVEKSEKKGVIKTIAFLIENAGNKGISKNVILDNLVQIFPDRKKTSMKNTINAQLPTRISKTYFKVEKMENGNYKKIN